MDDNSSLYEINATLFLDRMSRKYGRSLTLATIPGEEWHLISETGFDLVWLMGVWQRSPDAKNEAVFNPDLRRRYDEVLPGWGLDDIDGSPYAIYSYTLSKKLGKNEDFNLIKAICNNKGLRFLVDFVPNHLSIDTPWLQSNPEYFIQTSGDDINKNPDCFFSAGGRGYFAHGRDPHFPPWSDTVQLNYFSPGARSAMVQELLRICDLVDGVRCDMAMLVLNEIFEQVWGRLLPGYIKPTSEFWVEAISSVKKKNPEFLFVAEAYWNMESILLGLGFDFVYNKTLYDKLLLASAAEVRSYLVTNALPLTSAMNFIENHDEPRATAAFGRERSMSAAVVVATLPGLRMFHDGQLQGKRIHLPVQMITEPVEAIDEELHQFYLKLLRICDAPIFHDGQWKLLEQSQAWEGNDSYRNLLAWSWLNRNELKVVAVNYSADSLQARIKMPLMITPGRVVSYQDELTGISYGGNTDEINGTGLYVDLGPWKSHILSFYVTGLGLNNDNL